MTSSISSSLTCLMRFLSFCPTKRGGGGAAGPRGSGGTPGGANQGGGGGGGSDPPQTGGTGGTGVVFLRVPAATAPAGLSVTPGTNSVSTLSPSGDKLCTFTVSGTIVF